MYRCRANATRAGENLQGLEYMSTHHIKPTNSQLRVHVFNNQIILYNVTTTISYYFFVISISDVSSCVHIFNNQSIFYNIKTTIPYYFFVISRSDVSSCA